jgi:hypothetical protein
MVPRLPRSARLAAVLLAIAAQPASRAADNPAGDQQPQEKPAAPRDVIPVTDEARLRSLLGKTAIVRGVVKRVEVMTSQNCRVWFTEGKFILFIRKQDVQAKPDWKLDDLVAHEIHAGGEVADYRGRLELLIRGPEQIADTPEKVDLSKISHPKVSRTGTTEAPASPVADGPPVKRERAAVTQCVAITTSAQPQLVIERFEASMDSGARSGAPPLVLESYSGKERGPAVGGLEAVRKKLDGWPKGRVLRVRRAGGSSGPGLPHGLPTALLLRSMFDGFELPPRLAATGDFTAAGDLIGGREELLLLEKFPQPADSWLLVPEGAEAGLCDHLLDGKWNALTGAQIFAAKNLNDAVAVANALATGQWQAALAKFSELQKVLAGKPGAPPTNASMIVKSPAFRARVNEIAQAVPVHLSARVLTAAADGRLPKAYSTAGSGLRLRQFYLKIAGDLKTLRDDKPESRKKLRAHTETFEVLSMKCDPVWQRFSKSLDTLLEAVKDASKFESKDSSARGKKANDALKSATEAAKLEYEEALKFRE